MKVEIRPKRETLIFDQLKIGDVFTFDYDSSYTYMKIPEIKEIVETAGGKYSLYKQDRIAAEYILSDNMYWTYKNSICLETGEICECKHNLPVIKINTKLVLDN